jgi:ABC-type uncharacterized transport system substrate-binding protein
MRRRQFITLIGGAAASGVSWPLAARAQQQPAAMPVIGFLGASTPAAWGSLVSAFERRLRELGWIEQRTVTIEYRWAEGRDERYHDIANEFVRLKVDVIVTSGGAVLAAKKATSVIPIVFAMAVDPVGGGLVASLARPGGNVTGVSSQSADLAGKRLEILREVVPGLQRLGIIANIGYPAAADEMGEVQALARTLSLEVIRWEIRRADDIASAFETQKGRVDALYIVIDPLIFGSRVRINTLALAARLPAVCALREYVQTGALMSYGPSYPDLFRRAAEYVDKILRGAKSGDIPVEHRPSSSSWST